MGIYVAIPVIALYLLCHLKGKQRPDLGQSFGVFLGAVGAVVGLYFGINALQASAPCASVCEDQRLPMVLGAFVIEFVSVSQLVKSFYRLWT